jgi:phosphoglycerate dehydrogenase-like enzyme
MAVRIGIVGGVERQWSELARLAQAAGHRLGFHSGRMSGRGVDDLRVLISRSDVVVIVTDQNSHGAARAAKRMARKLRRGSVLLSRCGSARFQALLEALAAQERRALEAHSTLGGSP